MTENTGSNQNSIDLNDIHITYGVLLEIAKKIPMKS